MSCDWLQDLTVFFFFNETLSHFLRLFGSYFSEFYRLEAFFFKKDQFFLNIISQVHLREMVRKEYLCWHVKQNPLNLIKLWFFFRERTWTIFILHFHFYVDRKRIPTPLKISWGWLKILFVIQETYFSDKFTKRSRKKRTIFIGCNLPQFTDNLFNIKDISVIFIDNNDRRVKKHLRAV